MSGAAGAQAWDQWRAALALSHAGGAAAITQLRDAHLRLLALHDERGAALGAAALVLAGQMVGNYRGMPEWLARVAVVRQPGSPLTTGDDELLARTALLIGQLYFDLQDPDISANSARLVELLDGPALDVNLRLAAARVLLIYVEPRELRALAQRINSLVAPLLDDPAATPHRCAQWLLRWRTCCGYAKETQQEAAATQAAAQLAERHRLRDVRFELAFDEVKNSLNGAELPRAERALVNAEALLDPASLRERMLLDVTRMRVALLKDRVDDALFFAARARQEAVELQCPGPILGAYIVNEANVRLLANDATGARRQMENALPLLPAGFAQEVGEMITMITAVEAVERGDPQGRGQLAEVWAGLRQRQFYDSFDGHPAFRVRTCVMALEQGIEVDFVSSLIRKCGLAPPANAPEAWPWPLRIHALGQFTLWRDGVAITVEGKGQRKPLELLRALIAHGAHSAAKGLQTPEVVDMLWPDLEADAPKASFDMALMRLRKLLQVDGALRLAEGRLWLDPALVWCDVTAFERDCDLIHDLLDAPDQAVALADTARRLRLRLRAGSKLFGTGALEPWSVLPRERLARKFAAAVGIYGERLEARTAWIAAIALYEQGVAADALAEPCYRALMRCHLALGQPAAALRSFQRCRELLTTVLKVPPSTDTLAIAALIPQA